MPGFFRHLDFLGAAVDELESLRRADCVTGSARELGRKEAEETLRNNHIYVNKNLIPFDPLPASKTSGIRIGTPAMTSRGLGPDDFVNVADVIADVLLGETDEGRQRVEAICAGNGS